MTAVDGCENPGAIPFFVRYTFFFDGYVALYGPSLHGVLDQEDHKRLTQAASEQESRRAAANDRSQRAMVELCSRAASMNPLAYIREREEYAQGMNEREEAHYRSVLQSLSPAGRAAVQQFVDEHVAPSLNGSVITTPLWKTISEDDARHEMELDCYYAAHGEYPPEFQKQARESYRKLLADALKEN